MSFKILFLVLITALVNSVFAATAITDKKVLAFMNSTSVKSEELMPVFIRYKNLSAQNTSNQKQLMMTTLESEKKALQLLPMDTKRNKKTLWIANATLISLNQSDISELVKNPNVLSITEAQRPAHLVKEDFNQFFKISKRPYTYGLEKLRIPDLNIKYPELRGTNVQVGIIDTGMDPQHPDLVNKLILFKDFSNPQNHQALDDHGHGTHVAGTIAGGNTSGQAIGVAPDTKLFIAKCFDSSGSSTDSGLIEALQWMADPDENPNTKDAPQVISNSWNIDNGTSDGKNPEDEIFCKVISNLKALGIVSVFAAGNDGPSASTVLIPGSCPDAVTVGATNSSDGIASFSSRGPVKWKSVTLTKPNISAPGDSIDSAAPGGGYATKSGTSMATPHIAGVLSLIFQAEPSLTTDQAIQYLYSGAKDLGPVGADTVFGVGRSDALKSIDLIKNIQSRND